MGRRIIYKIEDNSQNSFTEDQWQEVQRLQHWYNSEFTWTAGKIAFKRYVLFPNVEEFSNLDLSIWEIIAQRYESLAAQGLSERDVITQLEKDRLVFVKWGGYFDDCLGSGFTRVADNEWNAFLVCDFLLKASTLLTDATIQVIDEGRFIKMGSIGLRNGKVLLSRRKQQKERGESPRGHVFSIVDPEKYDKHPKFKNTIPDFNSLAKKERLAWIQNWNWLGYGDSYDADGDDEKGFDLNKKIRNIEYLDDQQ
ncbi:MAG TPA: hypothetical protein VNN76_01005 [Bacteroidota bacterium]|nr:hypothetical protein [Bacteroidota bacterium]